jgi:hypothetical protein
VMWRNKKLKNNEKREADREREEERKQKRKKRRVNKPLSDQQHTVILVLNNMFRCMRTYQTFKLSEGHAHFKTRR